MFRQALGNLGRSPSAEKHVHIMLATGADLLMALRRHLFEDMMAWYCQQRGHADTLWYPHFFSPVTFESKRLTSDSDTADPCYGLRIVMFDLVSLVSSLGSHLVESSSIFWSFPNSSSLLFRLFGEPLRRSPITCPSSCHGRELHSGRDR